MSFDARLGAAILGSGLLVVLAGAAGAHEPGEPHKSWFESLQRPDNHLHPERSTDHKSLYCCGAADIVKTKFMVEPGSERHPDDVWYAWLNEAWTRIPPEKILKEFAPDDQAHLFVLAGTIQCFVRPRGGL
jgi:hypothetical protein